MRHTLTILADNYKLIADISDKDFKNYQSTPVSIMLHSTNIRMLQKTFKGCNIRKFIHLCMQ